MRSKVLLRIFTDLIKLLPSPEFPGSHLDSQDDEETAF